MDGLKKAQQEFFKMFRTGKFFILVAAGTVGSGKSFLTIGILHIMCCLFRDVRFAIIRKSEKNLKQTTIPTYNKVKKASFSVNSSQIVDFVARYRNGSEILFIWADITKDPDLDNIKGLELTGALIEEAPQVNEKYFDILKTRVGRWNNKTVPAFIMLNLNPSLGWVKDRFYDRHIDGSLPENVYFQEFDAEDTAACAGEEYIKQFDSLPEEEYKRFVKNVWDYSDTPNQLIKYEWYRQCIIAEYDPPEGCRGSLAIDPAWEGDDDTGLGRMHGHHIGWWETYPKQDPDFTGILGVQRAQEFDIPEDNVIVDPIGVGAATVLKMRNDLKFYPDLFKSGDTALDIFGVLEMYNKRSEAHWLFREALRLEEITITHHPDFQRQCLAIKYSIDEKKFRVRPKPEIKKDIGESPTYVDLATMLIHKWKTQNSGLAGTLFSQQSTQKREQKAGPSTRAAKERLKIRKANKRGAGTGAGY